MRTLNHYVVLGIAEDADDAAIRRAFRTLARRYHPDAGPGSSAAHFQQAAEAYETLGNPERRRAYDRDLRASRAARNVVGEPMISSAGAEPLSPRWVFAHPPTGSATTSEARLIAALFDEMFRAMSRNRSW